MINIISILYNPSLKVSNGEHLIMSNSIYKSKTTNEDNRPYNLRIISKKRFKTKHTVKRKHNENIIINFVE